MSPLLYIHAYCRNSKCIAREVTIFVKNYDHEPIPDLTCPLCGAKLTVHYTLADTDEDRKHQREARWSVSMQMYARDHETEHGGLVAYPASVFLREELPPTPPGWWDKR